MPQKFPTVQRLAEKNIRKWVQAEHVRERLAQGNGRKPVGPYVTISREAGAGGSEIARRAAEKLGWDVLDDEIVDYLAQQYGSPRHLVEIADERHIGWIEELLAGNQGGQQWTSAKYLHRLHHLLMLAAHHGNVIVVGRGARYILPADGGLSVRILAPVNFRVAQVAADRQVPPRVARRLIDESDRQQALFIKEHFHHAADDAHMYDMVVNVEKLSREDAAELIVDAVHAWMHNTGITVPAAASA
ncbi:MAG: cytidylate kinase-like family protein [Fuerstiella sp.]